MRRFVVLGFLCGVVACGNDVSGLLKTGAPLAGYACSNPVSPAGDFRLIYFPRLPADQSPDTTVWQTNRYTEPHRARDTVRTVTNQGGELLLIFGPTDPASTNCQTLFDSLNHHLPNVRGALLSGH